MSDVLTRTFTSELEVRARGDGRTIYGIAVPYNTPQRINARLVEQFAPGAFDHQFRAAHRVKFARGHLVHGGALIGAATMLRNDSAGLYGEWRVSKTPVGDETLELVRDGALSELSIGFREGKQRVLRGGIVERTRADLTEVAMVLEGAYGQQAVAAGVRTTGDQLAPPELPHLEDSYSVLDDWKALMPLPPI